MRSGFDGAGEFISYSVYPCGLRKAPLKPTAGLNGAPFVRILLARCCRGAGGWTIRGVELVPDCVTGEYQFYPAVLLAAFGRVVAGDRGSLTEAVELNRA